MDKSSIIYIQKKSLIKRTISHILENIFNSLDLTEFSNYFRDIPKHVIECFFVIFQQILDEVHRNIKEEFEEICLESQLETNLYKLDISCLVRNFVKDTKDSFLSTME